MADASGAALERGQFAARLPALAAWMEAAGLIASGSDLAVERFFEAGQSNPTYLLRSGNRRFVLRKQPYGELLPRAHNVLREHAIMEALHGAGLPVPRPLLAGRDRDVIGTDFVVMDYVPGAVHSDPALPGLSPAARGDIYGALADGLARLHGIDPAVLASAGIKARGDFVGRQVGSWQAAYVSSVTEPDRRIKEVASWLMAHRPDPDILRIAHGDYRLENIILDGSHLNAILDWELCTIGDPRADVAYCCLWYHMPREVLRGLAGLPLHDLGIPSEQRFLALYADRSGLDVTPTHPYFLSFAFYRLAAILQGVYRRALQGNAASPEALTRGEAAQFCLSEAARWAGRS